MCVERCPIAGQCGGCRYPDLSYAQQLALKRREIEERLDAYGIDQTVFTGLSACTERFAYRNKMEYTFGDAVKGGETTLGLHRRDSFFSVLTADACLLVPEDFNRIVRATLDFAKAGGYSFYHKKSHRGLLRFLVLRRGVRTGELLVHIVTTSQASFDSAAFAEIIRRLPLEEEVVGILHSIGDQPADAVVADRTDILYGRPFYREQISGLTFSVGAFSFFQTNVPAAERLYECALSLVPNLAGRTVYDLFSGTGTISLLLARQGATVTGVELVEEAVASAKRDALVNHMENCRFIAGDVRKVLEDLPRPELIVLDPPRSGVHPKAWRKILSYGVDEILYISCNPRTAIPDLAVAGEYGYRPRHFHAFDNFPGTKHVETIVLMSRVNK